MKYHRKSALVISESTSKNVESRYSALTRTPYTAADGQDTSNTSILAVGRRIEGVGQNTSETSILTANPGLGNNITNTMGISSTNNLGLGNNISNTMGISSTNNPGIGSNISNMIGMNSRTNLGLGGNMHSMAVSLSLTGEGQSACGTRSLTDGLVLAEVGQNTSYTSILTANLGLGNNITNTMGMSSTNNLGLGNNISNTMGMSSTNNLGLGSNMSNLAVSLSLAGDGQGASGTSSLRSNISNLNFSRQIVGRGQNTSDTSSLNINDRTGASGRDMTRGVGRANGLVRDRFTSRGYSAFSPWIFRGGASSKSLLQINLGIDALGLMDVMYLGTLTNYSRGEFFFSSDRDQRYHVEKQPHFSDEVASNVFPSGNGGNSYPEMAKYDKLNYPILFSPLHQTKTATFPLQFTLDVLN